MKIKVITYERGANLGDYESCRFTVESEVGTGEDSKEVFLKLRAFVEKAIQHEVAEHKKIQRNDRGARI